MSLTFHHHQKRSQNSGVITCQSKQTNLREFTKAIQNNYQTQENYLQQDNYEQRDKTTKQEQEEPPIFSKK